MLGSLHAVAVDEAAVELAVHGQARVRGGAQAEHLPQKDAERPDIGFGGKYFITQ